MAVCRMWPQHKIKLVKFDVCKQWTQHRCSKLKRPFKPNEGSTFKCAVCEQNQLGRPVSSCAVEIVNLEDVQDSARFIEAAASNRIRKDWVALGACKSFLSCKLLSGKLRGKIYTACVCSFRNMANYRLVQGRISKEF